MKNRRRGKLCPPSITIERSNTQSSPYFFDREFPPTYLPSTLNTNNNTLLDLKLKRIINQAQWNLLIPRNGVPDSKTFDVTLMICLIRNLTSISHPINGFDSLPLPGESTPGSDLARIKYYRNKLAHHDSNTIDSAYFNTAWGDISNVSINAILIKTDKTKTLLEKVKTTEQIRTSNIGQYYKVYSLNKDKLWISAWNGNIEITQILVENNADCNICAHSKQSVTETVNRNSGKILQAYKQSLFDSLVKETSNHITDYVSKKSVDYVFDVEAGSSPLHMACFWDG
ncbi:unnamed protein product [Mytilus edulis]|uniref:DZIP3-like HEPN domain-containing protein n=1 Tax=Mytilus edulis TaxID=6550 RepID=A0A8S3VC29_MYTED|nr:unnamed protein product [Mytilus edulis]